MKGHQNYYETFYKEWRQSWVLFNLLHSRLMRPYHPSIILWLLCRERVKILKLSCVYTYLLPPSLARPCGHTVEFLTVEEWNSQVRTGKASCRDYLTGVLFWPWLKGKKKKRMLGKVVYYCMPYRQHSLHPVLLCLSWQICVRGSGCGRDSAKDGQCSTYTHV